MWARPEDKRLPRPMCHAVMAHGLDQIGEAMARNPENFFIRTVRMLHRSSTPQAARDALKTLQHLRKTGQFQLATLDAMPCWLKPTPSRKNRCSPIHIISSFKVIGKAGTPEGEEGFLHFQSWPSTSDLSPPFFLFLDLLAQIILEPDLLNRFKLGFQPINVFIGIHTHFFQLVPGRVISNLGTVRDGFPQQL